MKTLTQIKLPVLTGIAMFGLGLVSAFAQPVYPTSGTYTPGTTADGLGQVAIAVPGRTDAANAIGIPQNSDTDMGEVPGNSATVNFTSLGFGGNIILNFSQPIGQGEGIDVEVFETSYNTPNCGTWPEYADAYISQDGCNWIKVVTNACQNFGFDLPASMPWALYLQIVDVSPNGSFAPNADGYDVDGARANYASSIVLAETGLARYAANGFQGNPQTTQGVTENGSPVPAARDNQNRMLGLPLNPYNLYANDVTTSAANNNFFSLGNCGSVVLKFPYTLFNGPGADVQIFETSFNDVASRTCGNYPEKALIQGSTDGVAFVDLVILAADAGNGEVAGTNKICRDGKLDFGSLSYVNYIKITDVTFQGVSNFPGNGDGFDVDAVLGLQNCGTQTARITNEESNSEMMEDALFVETYPNPVNDFVNVSVLTNTPTDNITFRMTDITGRVISTETVNGDGVNMIRDINMSSYKSGIYLLSVEGNGASHVVKIVKQ